MEYLVSNIRDFKTEELDYFYNKLYKLKKNKVNKYKHPLIRSQSIIGDILLSNLLINYNIDYSQLTFKFNKYGKPYIKNKIIHFNISHSFDYVVTIISKNKIGIDIEKIRKTSINTINYFATDNEKKYILSSSSNIEKRIFEIYTLKEAYFKMKGTNLNNIKNVEFEIINNKITCSDKKVKITLNNDIKGYIIAICEKI